MEESRKKLHISHRQIRIILAVLDGLFVVAMALTAYWMTTWSMYERFTISWRLVFWVIGNVAVALAVFRLFGMYAMVYVSIGFPELIRIIGAVTVVFLLNLIAAAFLRGYYIGYSVVVIYCLLLLMCVTAV